jgi:hypothetical protein
MRGGARSGCGRVAPCDQEARGCEICFQQANRWRYLKPSRREERLRNTSMFPTEQANRWRYLPCLVGKRRTRGRGKICLLYMSSNAYSMYYCRRQRSCLSKLRSVVELSLCLVPPNLTLVTKICLIILVSKMPNKRTKMRQLKFS